MLRSLYTLALVCALATPAAAQTATVSGTITDQTSAAVPGATVTLDGPGGTRDGDRDRAANTASPTSRTAATR